MIFIVSQGLTLQQSPKHPGLVRRFLYGYQVLNLTEGHHPLDPLLWDPESILEDSKLSGVLGGWVVWIHEFQPCPSFSPWKQKGWVGLLRTEEGKAVDDL
jgi:hypothetical protein